jgi:Na+-transporting methylmalonyl-CoA/oxaloacetate decarboxylase beta subunit
MDIGIIGGADGPTAIFVSSGNILYEIVAIIVACAIVTGIVIRIVRKRKTEV